MRRAPGASSSYSRKAASDKPFSRSRGKVMFPGGCRDFGDLKSPLEYCAVNDRKKKPERVADVVAEFLAQRGLRDRVEQAGIIPEWAQLVGEQIAAVTEPQSITANGTLFVAVRTNAWMNELSLLEPELLKSLNAKAKRAPIKRIRWQLAR